MQILPAPQSDYYLPQNIIQIMKVMPKITLLIGVLEVAYGRKIKFSTYSKDDLHLLGSVYQAIVTVLIYCLILKSPFQKQQQLL